MDEKYLLELSETSQRCKSNSHRIDELETEAKTNRDLIISVKELATEMKHMRGEMNDYNERLKELEKKPAKRYEQVVGLIITRYRNSYTGFFISQNWNVRC